MAQVLREVSQAKGQMREQWGPELERFLVRWGYVAPDQARNPEVQQEGIQGFIEEREAIAR